MKQITLDTEFEYQMQQFQLNYRTREQLAAELGISAERALEIMATLPGDAMIEVFYRKSNDHTYAIPVEKLVEYAQAIKDALHSFRNAPVVVDDTTTPLAA